jgi:hypothetical protein
MATVPLVGEDAGPYDAIIFYESFHHCLDHAALLDRLPALLAPGGRVVLAAEPIYPSTTPIVPYPWGLRLDGLSLREIRRRGWLELGFTAEYVTSLFLDRDWMLQRHQMGEHALSDLWLARPREPGERGRGKAVMDEPASAPIFGSIVGERDTLGGTLGIWGAHNGFLQFGPYLSLRAGLYEAAWSGRTGGPSAPDSSARFEVATDQGQNILASYTLDLPRDAPSERIDELARLPFYIPADRDDVEARVYVENRADITLHRVRVEKVVV